jgi:hypothetical protein
MNEGRDFSIKDVVLQGLFVIVFVFILITLFPMKGDVKKTLDPLYQRIFNENVQTMQQAAKSYYTEARLPKNVGDRTYMTLSEMLEKKLVLPFVDSQNNQCDLNNSYVEVTKMDDEYNLKVNLKCTDKSDYVVTHVGCYNYCENAVCEKEEETEKPVVNKPTTTTPTNNTNNNNNNTTTKGVTYYEYYTQTVEKQAVQTTVKVPYSVAYSEKMCVYREVTRLTKNFYSVGYVSESAVENSSTSLISSKTHNYGFKLSSAATNVKLKGVYEGTGYFSLSTYLYQKNNNEIYDYNYTPSAYSATVPSSTTTFNKSALNSAHISSVRVNGTTNYNNVYVARDWNTSDGYKFDYTFNLSRYYTNMSLDNGSLTSYYDSKQGYILFVPLRFAIEFDVLHGYTKTDECSDLNSAQKDYIIDNYYTTKYKTEYKNETKTEYKDVVKNSAKKWTTKKNVSGYIYTGATKVVK